MVCESTTGRGVVGGGGLWLRGGGVCCWAYTPLDFDVVCAGDNLVGETLLVEGIGNDGPLTSLTEGRRREV